MDEDDIIRIQVEQLDKEKRELSLKMKTQEKRVCISSLVQLCYITCEE